MQRGCMRLPQDMIWPCNSMRSQILTLRRFQGCILKLERYDSLHNILKQRKTKSYTLGLGNTTNQLEI